MSKEIKNQKSRQNIDEKDFLHTVSFRVFLRGLFFLSSPDFFRDFIEIKFSLLNEVPGKVFTFDNIQ